MKKVVVIVSGGMDSITMLHKLKSEGHELKAISFNYGQKHVKELEKAKENCELLGIEHKVIDMQFLKELVSNSALTSDQAVPEGHYEDENMKATVVPNRNMIMASIAIGWAVNEGFNAIAMGVHAGDHAIYPDCRPEFVEALNAVAKIANYEAIEVLAPYLATDKVGILEDGLKIGVDYTKTWTCYKGLELPCGKCGSCQERTLAFLENNAVDPLYTIEGWEEAVKTVKPE